MVDVISLYLFCQQLKGKGQQLLYLPNNRFQVFTIILLLAFITLSSCGVSKQSNNQNQDLQALVDKILGTENIVEFNEPKSFALCQQKPGTDHARRQYHYIVVRMKDNTVVNEGVFSMGYVKWLDHSSIEVFSGSPSPGEPDGTKKIIHVNSSSGKNPVH